MNPVQIGGAFLFAIGFSSVLAQGTFNANNYFNPPGSSEMAWVSLDPSGQPLSRIHGRVQILAAADQSTLSPNGDEGVRLTLDGIFFVNGLRVPGVPPGSSVTLIVRAWDVQTGSTYATALNRSQTQVQLRELGGPGGPAATFRVHSDFVGISPICLSRVSVRGVTLTSIADGNWRLQSLVDLSCNTWFRLEVSTDLTEWRLLQAKRVLALGQTGVPLEYEFSSHEAGQFFRLRWDHP